MTISIKTWLILDKKFRNIAIDVKYPDIFSTIFMQISNQFLLFRTYVHNQYKIPQFTKEQRKKFVKHANMMKQ